MLNWTVRYAPVVDILAGVHVGSVLDVGSGAHGISHFLKGPQIVQTDLDVNQRAPGCDVVRADALRLPFRNASFDAVLSLDLVEHLAADDRVAAIEEMFRVARDCVIVGFPVAPGAPAADAQLAASLARRQRPIPPWLQEHQANGYPTPELGRVPAAGWTLVDQVDNDPIWLHKSIAWFEHHRLLGRLSLVPLPLPLARVISRRRGSQYYRSISVFRRSGVKAARA